jgi:hypothetical protein
LEIDSISLIARVFLQGKPQPSFNKEFSLLVQDLSEKQSADYTNVIVADSFKQIERLTTIFEELDPFLKVQSLGISFRQGFIDENLKSVAIPTIKFSNVFIRINPERSFLSPSQSLKRT